MKNLYGDDLLASKFNNQDIDKIREKIKQNMKNEIDEPRKSHKLPDDM